MFRRLACARLAARYPQAVQLRTSPADPVISTAPDNILVGRLTGLALRGRNHAAVNTGSWRHHVAG